MHKFSTEVEMTHETEFTTVGFATLKVVKKIKNNKFFKKKKFFLASTKLCQCKLEFSNLPWHLHQYFPDTNANYKGC